MTRPSRWTPERVAELARLRDQERIPWAALAERYGVSEARLRTIHHRKHAIPNGLVKPRPKQAEHMRDKLLGKMIDEIALLKEQVQTLLAHCRRPNCQTCAAIRATIEED